MLTSHQAAVLDALDEDGGFTTGTVSERATLSYGGNKRQRSGAVRSWLTEMMRQGLVDLLDDQKPACWVRTPKGSQSLVEYARRNPSSQILKKG